MSVGTRGRVTDAHFIRVSWGTFDGLQWVSIVGATGVGLAAVMAIFGLPPVDLHGPLHRMGIMDPLCGGTRAARLTARGDVLDAWRYNPLGILATISGGLAVLRLVVGIATRRWLNLRLTWTPRRARVAVAIAIVLIAALEIRQQGRSELLTGP